MSCTVRSTAITAKPAVVSVNGVVVPRDAIAREVQHHPAPSPAAGWKEAARALAVRELLLQEARRIGVTAEPLSDADGRRETEAEASIRALIEGEVAVPQPDPQTCHRYYEQNRRRFRSPDIYEAAHILIAAHARDAEGYARARETANGLLAGLRERPESFAELAGRISDCTSGAQGGNLGQISAGQTTPEFEHALKAIEPGSLCCRAGRDPLWLPHYPARTKDRRSRASFRSRRGANRGVSCRERPAPRDRSICRAPRFARRNRRDRSGRRRGASGSLRDDSHAWRSHRASRR